jgi:hypothetical protein
MDCKRCGGAMMPETVIQLRRGLIGFRETRSAGAYCVTCQIGVAAEGGPSTSYRPASFRSGRTSRRLWPAWWHPAVVRSRLAMGRGNRSRLLPPVAT